MLFTPKTSIHDRVAALELKASEAAEKTRAFLSRRDTVAQDLEAATARFASTFSDDDLAEVTRLTAAHSALAAACDKIDLAGPDIAAEKILNSQEGAALLNELLAQKKALVDSQRQAAAARLCAIERERVELLPDVLSGETQQAADVIEGALLNNLANLRTAENGIPVMLVRPDEYRHFAAIYGALCSINFEP